MKAPEVKGLVDILTERVNNLVREIDELNGEYKGTVQALNDFRREQEKSVALLKQETAELKSWKSEQKAEKVEQTRRWWAFGPNLIGAGIALIGTLVGIAVNIGLSLYLHKK